jgi:hypothetical protein
MPLHKLSILLFNLSSSATCNSATRIWDQPSYASRRIKISLGSHYVAAQRDAEIIVVRTKRV